MDRLQHADGFTLIEMVLVLLLVSFCIVLFPMYQPFQEGRMRMQMEALRQELLQFQTQAIHEKKHIQLQLVGNQLVSPTEKRVFAMQCQGSLSFNPSGNVNHAMSIHCSMGRQKGTLVIQLGCGRMYVK